VCLSTCLISFFVFLFNIVSFFRINFSLSIANLHIWKSSWNTRIQFVGWCVSPSITRRTIDSNPFQKAFALQVFNSYENSFCLVCCFFLPKIFKSIYDEQVSIEMKNTQAGVPLDGWKWWNIWFGNCVFCQWKHLNIEQVENLHI
jgi:hypothetical protein